MNLAESAQTLIEKNLKAFAPPPRLSVSEWADRERILSPESSAEPGKWSTARAEYQREILNAISDPEVERVVFMKSAQVGATEVLNNAVGYFISQDPSPILVVYPTKEVGEAWSKDRLAPMLRDCPALKGRVKDVRSRDSNNTITHKIFPGGHITIAGSNSPASLRSRPIRVVACDDIDAFEPTVEGDSVDLAIARSKTFWNRKIFLGSTPTIKDASRIEMAYEASDKRQFWVPCQKCGTFQVLRWGQVKWPKDTPLKAVYVCSDCSYEWTDTDKNRSVPDGKWKAEKPFLGTAGFHINELYSPWVTLGNMAQRFLEAKKFKETLRVFVNTSLAEVWSQGDDRIESDPLYNRRENYPARVPMEVLVLVAGVDIQDTRIEVEVLGVGLGEETWSIEYRSFFGSPAKPEVWADLGVYLDSLFDHQHGFKVRIAAAAIDTGGHHTEEAYKFARSQRGKRIYAIKGSNQHGQPVINRPSWNERYGIHLWSIGTDTAKEIVYARLKIEDPGPGYCHFPMDYDKEYFDQLTSEKITLRYSRGVPSRVWVPIRDRNEALDCRVYAVAALTILKPNLEKLSEQIAEKTIKKEEKKEEFYPDMPDKNQKKAGKFKKFGKKGFIGSWR